MRYFQPQQLNRYNAWLKEGVNMHLAGWKINALIKRFIYVSTRWISPPCYISYSPKLETCLYFWILLTCLSAFDSRIWGVVNRFLDWWLKTQKGLPLDIRGRHHLQSSPLLRLDNDPSSAASFWSILGSHFLVACSGRPATLLEFPPTSEIFAP